MRLLGLGEADGEQVSRGNLDALGAPLNVGTSLERSIRQNAHTRTGGRAPIVIPARLEGVFCKSPKNLGPTAGRLWTFSLAFARTGVLECLSRLAKASPGARSPLSSMLKECLRRGGLPAASAGAGGCQCASLFLTR